MGHSVHGVNDYHTGNQEAVFQAIKAGFVKNPDIMKATGLTRAQVNTALAHLIDRGRIHRNLGGYYAAGTSTCLLEQVWRRA
jgi:predicted Rossmann fold nucleotide-binding protein DprA/Smf involved in DNA uptake